MPKSEALSRSGDTLRNAKPFENNIEYLAASLDYLALLANQRALAKRVARQKAGLEAKRTRRSRRWEDDGDDTSLETDLQRLADISEEVAHCRSELNARTYLSIARRADLPLEALALEHGLSEFEKLTLVLVLGPTLDNTFEQVIEDATDMREGEVGTVLDILCDSLAEKVKARKCFTSSSKLLSLGLLNLGYSRGPMSETDFLSMKLELPRRVSSHLLGEYDIDDQLVTFSSVIEPEVDLEHVVLPNGKKEEVLELVSRRDDYVLKRKEWGLDDVLSYGKGVVMLFSGPSGTGKTMLAHALARKAGLRLMQVDIRSVLAYSNRDFEENLERVFHEARLQKALIFFDEADEMFADRRFNAAMPTILREFEKLDGVCILATNMKQILDEALERRILYRLDFELPPPELREKIWRVHLPPETPLAGDIHLDDLAEEFEISGGLIKNAVLLAMHRAITRPDGKQSLTQDDLRFGARLQRRHSLERQTDKIVPKVTLEDVILDSAKHRQVTELVSAARKRSTVFGQWGFGKKMNLGRSLSAVFSGPSGVGKTMTAEAIAGELGQALYVVNLSAILSKYVGETEKNLCSVFENARESQAILFFDEADSLFASRLQEDSSHAFYINAQINSLLQAIEKHDGIVILATNRADAFDGAFERRIRYRIEFSEPNATARKAIWKNMIPDDAPTACDIDFSRLAETFPFTGGTIKNVVLRSAFAAAMDGGIITQQLLEEAAFEESSLGAGRSIGFVETRRKA